MTLPWGRYRGRNVEEVPSGYLLWLFEESNIGEPHRTEIREELAGRLGLDDVVLSQLAPPADLARDVAELVAAGYRARSARLHPDHQGGDVRAMQKLNAARDWCRATGFSR